MEHVTITALIRAERQATARDPHHQSRLDALRERDRALAARGRAEWRMRVRATMARGIRRLAEVVEPPRPVCVSRALDPC